MNAVTMYLQCLSIIRTFKVTGTTLEVKVAELPAGVQEGGGIYDRNFRIFALEILMTGHLFNLYLCLYIISSHLYVMLFCVSQLVFCAHCCAEVRQLYYPLPFPSSLPILKTPFQMDVSRTVVLKVGLDHRVRYRASYGANSDMTLDHF